MVLYMLASPTYLLTRHTHTVIDKWHQGRVRIKQMLPINCTNRTHTQYHYKRTSTTYGKSCQVKESMNRTLVLLSRSGVKKRKKESIIYPMFYGAWLSLCAPERSSTHYTPQRNGREMRRKSPISGQIHFPLLAGPNCGHVFKRTHTHVWGLW